MQEKPKNFERGCWVRVILNPEAEITILQKREGKSWDQLLGHANRSSPDYTDYSCCNFIKEKTPICLFNYDKKSSNFGVFIRSFNRAIDCWCNGTREKISNEITSSLGRSYGWRKEDHFININADIISREIDRMCQIYLKGHPWIFWNEGKLRYQRDDITGILVNPDDRDSVVGALNFRKSLKLNVHLFSYDEDSGICKYCPSIILQQKHGLTRPASATYPNLALLTHAPVVLSEQPQHDAITLNHIRNIRKWS